MIRLFSGNRLRREQSEEYRKFDAEAVPQVVSIVPAIQYVAVDYRGEGRHLVSSTISPWPCLVLYASLVRSYRFYL